MAIVAVTSATPGTGKTTVAINVAVALGRFQRRVVLLDAAPDATVVARRLGQPNASAAVEGRTSVDSDLTRGPHGIRVIAAPTALALTSLTHTLAAEADFLIVDSATCLDEPAASVTMADQVVVVMSVKTTARNRATGLIRSLVSTGAGQRIGVVVNGVTSHEQAQSVVDAVVTRLPRARRSQVDVYGCVATDPHVPRSQMMQRAVLDCHPGAPASRCLEAVARRIAYCGPFGGGVNQLLPVRARRAWGNSEAQQCA